MATFERLNRELLALEVERAELSPDDPRFARVTARREAMRRELEALPNLVTAEIVSASRLDRALAERLRALALEQRLVLARVRPGEPEARRLEHRIAAVDEYRRALHLRQDSLHARYREGVTLSAGEWVRVSVPVGSGGAPRRSQGRAITLRADTLTWVQVGGAVRSLPLPAGAVLERATSRRGHAVEGTLIGLVVGGVAAKIRRGPFDDGDDLRLLGYAPAGAVIGGLLGSAIYTEDWTPFAWQHARVVFAPNGIGGGIEWALPPLGRTR